MPRLKKDCSEEIRKFVMEHRNEILHKIVPLHTEEEFNAMLNKVDELLGDKFEGENASLFFAALICYADFILSVAGEEAGFDFFL